jgi:23S rRNA (cytosine1962-C5)-methyltransferase
LFFGMNEMSLPKVVLKRKRERTVQRRHPWLFSGSISKIDDNAEDGGLVDVFSSGGEWLARGYLNRRSQITVRLLVWDNDRTVDLDFWRRGLERAIKARAALRADPETTAFRLVNAESDGLPGLIIDCYDGWLVLQVLTLGIERQKRDIVELLVELVDNVRGIYERSDVEVREKEGLESVAGQLWGEAPPDLVEIIEYGHRFLVDLKEGHKTGFYLDQRSNRAQLPAYCGGAEVLNAFAYTGAFGIYALSGGASHVINVDTSVQALALAQRHVTLNDFADARVIFEAEDIFAKLRAYRAAGRRFDVIVLDPPRFAASRSHVKRASRGYKDINWIAMQILREGGVLFSFSCSGLVSRELFQRIIFGAALDAGRDVQIVGQLSQASDHPIALNFPEASYLKGVICRVW